ncbi:MAG: oligopeptide transporter, OPT family [Bacteroidales bacterium]|nr:oligopeptide transporter, OPT family [Bacteroidales bacterium]MDY2705148.1 oligopeptide transporter, OPT family [Alloprevotella sp.]
MKETNLPENAFRELREGETYEPLMKPERTYREVTPWSIFWGLLMAVIFSAATAYLGLKVGQVFEAAIPITIIAVGLSGAIHRKDPLGENVIIQSIGACSGMIVAGAIFTLPALYILQNKYPELTVNFIEVFLASLLGGVLGILFLIPFRKYFVKDMHGKYPFPEATASTQVLLSGEKSGSQTKPLLVAGLIGGLYDFAVASFGAWTENFTSRVGEWGVAVADKAKLVFSCNTSAALLGMGYIVGLKYAAIICAGSCLVWWGIVPGIALLFPDLAVNDEGLTASAASAEQIFGYAKSIGIGGIAMAGIIGVIKSWGVIKSAFSLVGQIMNGGKPADETVRTQRDLSMKIVAFGSLLTILVTALFFYFDVMGGNLLFTIVGILIVAVIAFLFTTVAANAIAIVGSNPVSGMTLMTLILSSIIMVLVGLKGTGGMVAALIMGGVVCTALSSAGAFITDLKIGYWLGSTPKYQQTYKFLGILVSAATVGGVIMILNKAYGFTPDNSDVMAAPQARAMAAVIEPLMSGQSAPWLLYGIGAGIALVLNWCGISALAFALGMFIPLQLNIPLIVGGAVNWYVNSRSKDTELNRLRNEKGTLLASGFIAGGALMGVVSAGLQFGGLNFASEAWTSTNYAQWLSLVMYIALIVYLAKASMSVKK